MAIYNQLRCNVCRQPTYCKTTMFEGQTTSEYVCDTHGRRANER